MHIRSEILCVCRIKRKFSENFHFWGSGAELLHMGIIPQGGNMALYVEIFHFLQKNCTGPKTILDLGNEDYLGEIKLDCAQKKTFWGVLKVSPP